MDFQRILIMLGLAVTTYMLILAWNEDYGSGRVDNDSVIVANVPQDNLLPDINVNTVSTTSTTADNGQIDFLPLDNGLSAPVTETAVDDVALNTQNSRYVTIASDVLNITIDTLGGDIVEASLIKFPVAINQPDSPFVLMDPRNAYAAQSGLIGQDGTDTAAGRPTFAVVKNHYDLSTGQDEIQVELKTTQGSVLVTKRFTLRRDDYLVDVDYDVVNNSDQSWSAALFGQIKRDGQAPALVDQNSMGLAPYTGGATYANDAPYTKVTFEDVEEKAYKAVVEGGYIAMVQHYFVTAWVPKGKQDKNTFHARKLGDRDAYLFGFTSPNWSIAAGGRDTKGAQFYIGPKDQYKLEEISPGLNLTVDYGFLWWLAQPMFGLLTFIHGIVSNWGLSIIVLTLIVKTLLFPLSAAGFKSMAKMRKLQPEMARLKERYGDDKQQFTQAMMALYKKEGANPLGGCLPILMQMPVFLALYWTLMESYELRQAPFMLWINDLSVMDPYFVLPILMGASMFVTQMMQPEPPDPMQAKVMKFMPVMFTFFFLWFPSGLVLYWLVNNLLSIAQQWYVTKQVEKAG
ncbi:MAG: membrane protein insertase YidC [SAR86 cluster bacterium]|uniref:Membrane protein insertase YidC n=1 Tax=SAR86 cluster bacterium TaxID=2030880 RepID=A0A973AA06_9GAMM|nr:membrane protein insertase YidC [SAR86 cluster bacterium]